MRWPFGSSSKKPQFDFQNISLDKNYVFIHVPKNAGTSICTMLDINTSRHHTVSEYISMLTQKEYDKLFSFAIVRNPFSRFLSLYNYARMEESHYHSAINPEKAIYGKHMDYDILKDASIEDAARLLIQDKLIHNPPHNQWKPQCFWLKDENKLKVRFIGRFENIEKDMKIILNEIGILEHGLLPVINSSKRSEGDYRSLINSESRKILEEYYKEDLEEFNYEF